METLLWLQSQWFLQKNTHMWPSAKSTTCLLGTTLGSLDWHTLLPLFYVVLCDLMSLGGTCDLSEGQSQQSQRLPLHSACCSWKRWTIFLQGLTVNWERVHWGSKVGVSTCSSDTSNMPVIKKKNTEVVNTEGLKWCFKNVREIKGRKFQSALHWKWKANCTRCRGAEIMDTVQITRAKLRQSFFEHWAYEKQKNLPLHLERDEIVKPSHISGRNRKWSFSIISIDYTMWKLKGFPVSFVYL